MPRRSSPTLQVLVAIDGELGRIGKVGAELDEKRPKLFIDAVEIVEVHIGTAVIGLSAA
jgi:hypothetical protein